MRFNINNLSDDVVNILSKKAKQKNQTRNKYIIDEIKNILVDEEVQRYNYLLDELINKNLEVLNMNTKVLSKFCEETLIDIEEFIIE